MCLLVCLNHYMRFVLLKNITAAVLIEHLENLMYVASFNTLNLPVDLI